MPDSESNCSGLSSEVLLARRRHDGCAQRMLAALVEAGGQAQHLVGVGVAGAPRRARSWAGLRSASGLVDDERVDLAQVLDRRRIAEQHAMVAPRPVATMIDIGVARPSAQGQAMISTATALIRP
jgi:hypothetical protein